MPNSILFYINFISNKTLDKKKYILFFRIFVIKIIDPLNVVTPFFPTLLALFHFEKK